MKREEQIRQASIEYTISNRPMCIGGGVFSEIADELNRNKSFEAGAKWADKTMIYKACKCFCDNLCEKSLCGMCFHKYDSKHQIKNSFQYNECNELQLLRKVMEE